MRQKTVTKSINRRIWQRLAIIGFLGRLIHEIVHGFDRARQCVCKAIFQLVLQEYETERSKNVIWAVLTEQTTNNVSSVQNKSIFYSNQCEWEVQIEELIEVGMYFVQKFSRPRPIVRSKSSKQPHAS